MCVWQTVFLLLLRPWVRFYAAAAYKSRAPAVDGAANVASFLRTAIYNPAHGLGNRLNNRPAPTVTIRQPFGKQSIC